MTMDVTNDQARLGETWMEIRYRQVAVAEPTVAAVRVSWWRRVCQRLNRVLAIGRDTYIRLYPNPGFGIRFGSRRIALSWYGGVEVFEYHPRLVWQRVWSIWSRIKRPGGN